MSGKANQALSAHYGTKSASVAKQLARAAYAAALAGREHQAEEVAAVEREKRHRDGDASRAAQRARMAEGPASALKHTPIPLLLRPEIPLTSLYMLDDLDLGSIAPNGPRPLMGSSIPLGFDGGMIRIAAATGAELAHTKEAGFAGVLGAPGLTQGLKGVGQGLTQGLKGVGQRVSQGIGSLTRAKPPGPGLFNQPVPKSTNPLLGPTRAAPVTPPVPGSVAKAAPAAGTAQPKTAPPPNPGPAATPNPPAAAPNTGQVPAAEKPGVVGRLKEEYDAGRLGKGLRNAAIVGGLGYMGLKALQGVKEVMSQEPVGVYQYGAGGPQVPYGLNQYGQPQLW